MVAIPSSLDEPVKGALEPIRQLNQHAVANVEKLAVRQIDSLKVYSELVIGQLKTAAEVKDLEGVSALISQQTDVLKTVTERLMADAKAMIDIAVASLSHGIQPSPEAAPVAPARIKAA